MKLLYLTGTEAAIDAVTTQQLSRVAPQLSVTTVATPAEALVEIRRLGGFHALLMSPTLARNETLALITSLRTDRVPIAIVPVVGETQQDFLASAIGAGADDVLVLRGETLVQPTETLTRIRQSPHLFPSDDRRLRVLYAGSDPVVWDLLEQLPFVRAEQAACSVDGGCSVRTPGAADGSLRCDVVLVDEKPNEAHPLQVVKSIKAQASDLSVVVLSPPGAADISTAAFDLGADDAVLKTSAYRRRLVATLRRVHQRLELMMQHATLRDRESRLRQIVETMPEGLTVISGDGTVLAMNAAGLTLVGASRPREVVGREFNLFVAEDARSNVRRVLEDITAGVAGSVEFTSEGVDGAVRHLELRGVRLERDARGGRGVIGILRLAGAPGTGLTEEGAPDAFERERALESALSQAESRLRELDEELRGAELRGADLERDIDIERRRWSAERSALESRAAETSVVADAAATLESALEATRAELDRLGHDRMDERAAWADARAELENRLSELRVAFDSTRQEYESARHELEARRDDTRSHDAVRADLEAALDLARREVAGLKDEHGRTRSEWDEARVYLEGRCAELLAASANQPELQAALERARHDAEAQATDAAAAREARTELESTLEAAQGLLRQTTNEYRADRVRWDDERRELDARLLQLAEAADGREALEAATLSIRSELHQAGERHRAERAAWDEERRGLDSRLRDVSQAAEGSQALEATLQTLRGELQQAAERHRTDADAREAERAAWQTERAVWQTERGAWDGERASRDADRDRWEAERRALEASLQDVRQSVEGSHALESTLQNLRAELQGAADRQQADRNDREAERAAWQSERQGLGHALAEARTECDRALDAIQTERGQLESLRAEIERSEAAHRAEREASDRKRRELESQLSDIESLAGARASLESALHAVRTELGEVRDAFNRERAAWDRAREDADRERRDAEAARAALEQEVQTAERRVDERREQLETLERERRHLQADHASLAETLRELRAVQAGLAEARTAALAERDEARDQREHLRNALDQVQRKLDQEQTRRSLLEAAVREARKDAEGRLAVVEAEFASTRRTMEGELADATSRLERLTEESAIARQRLEDAAAVASTSYERLLGNSLIGHAVMTPDGLLVRCNDTFAQLFGYLNARDALARSAGRPFPSLAGRAWLDAKLAAERRLDHVESILDRIDGRAIRVVESAVMVDEPGGQTVVERILVDRTGSRVQDDRLRHADRLEEVGTLVAAMAPDIESLIASVASSGSELASSMPPSDARREHTTRLVAHAAQAGDLIRQLANFSLKQVRPAEPVDLADAVKRSERLLRPLLGPHVGLKHQFGRSDTVAISQDDLDRLLSALVVAARDVLPIGGTVIVETARVDVDEAQADPSAGLQPGAHLLLSVTASGYGVQPAQRTAALDAVASRCGGHVRVVGEPGRTASFRVYFTRWPGMAGPMA